MTINIKCDQLPDGWNYDTCRYCKHFSLTFNRDNKTQWRCSLNKGSAAEKRSFRILWVDEYLRAHEMMTAEDNIVVEYVGKKKRRSGQNGN
jgi:hypothetical protein